jgi:hypothetical protein
MFQRRVCKHVGLVGALALSLVMCSRLAAQSNRASTAAQTEHAVLDNIDALQQISTAIKMLSKRVSASVVQIFSTGYISNGDRELNTSHHVAGNSQADPFITSGLRKNKRVNSHDTPAGIN